MPSFDAGTNPLHLSFHTQKVQDEMHSECRAPYYSTPHSKMSWSEKKTSKNPKFTKNQPISWHLYQFHGETRNGPRPLRPRSVKLAETPVFKDSEHGAEDNVSDRSLLSFRPSRQTKRPYLKLAATPNDVARAVIWQYRAFSGSWSLALLVTTSSCYQWTATSARAWG